MASVEANLVGGPADGAVLIVPDHVPVIRIPMMSCDLSQFDESMGSELLDMGIALYCRDTRPGRLSGKNYYFYQKSEWYTPRKDRSSTHDHPCTD